MKFLHRTQGIILALALMICLLPTLSLAASEPWSAGNTDLNILNGGVMLSDGGDFYFSDGGIFLSRGEDIFPLSADLGGNLNLYGGYIYYTVGADIRRVPASGGRSETIHTAAADIKQMYVIEGEYLYLTEGAVYEASGGAARRLTAPEGVLGLIPTQFGNLYLTREVLSYTLFAENERILTGVQSAYTDEGFLAVQIDNQNYMASLETLFSGFDSRTGLLDFNIHGSEPMARLLSVDEERFVSEYNENDALQCDLEAILLSAGMKPMTEETEPIELEPELVIIPTVSQGQINIVKRSRQLTGVKWTPLEDRYQWGYRGMFEAGTTYTGLPYGQPVNTNGYVGFGISLSGFAEATLDNTTKFYSGYSTYNKIAPYYSTDCSGFASYCWQTDKRRTTYSLPEVCEKISEQSIYALQIGDILNHTTSHVVLVTDVLYDAQGAVCYVEISEQTPVITKITRYGEGEKRSLASLQAYYLEGGYAIYRNPHRDYVTYTPNAYVSVDGETEGLKEPAPKVRVTGFPGGRRLELYSEDKYANIYYTLDGSMPTTGSALYAGEDISTTDSIRVRAIAYSGGYADNAVLSYTMYVPFADTPRAEVTGTTEGELISSGSRIALVSSEGTTIYYTTDGSEPTANSHKYSSPITVTDDISIRAMAQGDGYRQSETASINYKLGHVYTIEASAGSGGTVSPSGKTEVFESRSLSLTIAPKAGYAITDVTVDGVSQGAVSSYTFSDVRESHSIAAYFTMNLSTPFTDVNESDWYYEAVGFAYAKGLFNGTSATTFSPQVTMTRGMFVTVLGRFAGMELTDGATVGLVTGSDVNIRSGPSTDDDIEGVVKNRLTAVEVTGQRGEWYGVKCGDISGFIRGDLISVYGGEYSDLAAGQYYSPYVQWAYLSGVAKGAASGVFDADTGVSRQDMSLMLNNYVNIYGIELPIVESKTPFYDDAQIGDYAKAAVYALQQANVVNGTGDGMFTPYGTATRAEVAQIFENYVKALS